MIKVGIVGYGNLGKGVEKAIAQNDDLELVAVFTRRNPEQMAAEGTEARFEHISAAEQYIGKIDVMILCGGSATDLPEQTPVIAKLFNTVDSFDTHAKIPEFYEAVNALAEQGGHVSVISTGWDPGLFSMNRSPPNPFCRKEKSTHSGAKGSAKDTRMRFVVYQVLKPVCSIPFL